MKSVLALLSLLVLSSQPAVAMQEESKKASSANMQLSAYTSDRSLSLPVQPEKPAFFDSEEPVILPTDGLANMVTMPSGQEIDLNLSDAGKSDPGAALPYAPSTHSQAPLVNPIVSQTENSVSPMFSAPALEHYDDSSYAANNAPPFGLLASFVPKDDEMFGSEDGSAHNQVATPGKKSNRVHCPNLDCDKHYGEAFNLVKHIKNKHGTKDLVKCAKCGSYFLNQQEYEKHASSSVRCKTQQTKDRRRKINNPKLMLASQSSNNGEATPKKSIERRYFKCQNLGCNKEYGETFQLVQHIKNKHEGKGLINCPACPCQFLNDQDYKKHASSSAHCKLQQLNAEHRKINNPQAMDQSASSNSNNSSNNGATEQPAQQVIQTMATVAGIKRKLEDAHEFDQAKKQKI